MFLLFTDKRYYILENKKGQICLIDGPFYFFNRCKKRLDVNCNQWIELLNPKQLASALT